MVDTRVWKMFLKIVTYCFGMVLTLTGIVYASQEFFDNPAAIPVVLMFIYTFYMLFKIAECKVDMDRKAEQRLANQIKDAK